MNKTKSTKRIISLLLVMVMLAAELVTPIGAIAPTNLLSSGSLSSDSLVEVDETDLSGTGLGTLTDTNLTNYNQWKNSLNASVSIKEDADGKYINVYDNDASVAPDFLRNDLDASSGIRTITFDLRINALDANKNGAVFELHANGLLFCRVYFKDTLSVQYGNSVTTNTGIVVAEGEWAKVVLVTKPADTFDLYYADEKLMSNVGTVYGRDFTSQTDLRIYSEAATAGADFDIKNYAIYSGDVAASLLPNTGASRPVDTISLNNRLVGTVTDTTVTNYNTWKDTQDTSVSVKTENGEKYINILDNSATIAPVIDRQNFDFRTGVTTIAFDLRVNTLGSGGPEIELYDTYTGTSWVRIEIGNAIVYGEGKKMTTLPTTTFKGDWISIILVVNGDNNTYTFYYNGEAVVTDAAPRMTGSGVQTNFNSQLIDLEIRSSKANTGCDFDVKDYAAYTGDVAAQLLSGYTPIQPPAPDPNAPIDTVDLSELAVGPLTNTALTNYSEWKNSQNASVSIKEEADGKYINVLDNDTTLAPSFYRKGLDAGTGIKTFVFDLRINALDENKNGAIFELKSGGSTVARMKFNSTVVTLEGNTGAESDTGIIVTEDKWAKVICVTNPTTKRFTLYYAGEKILSDVGTLYNRAITSSTDLLIYSAKETAGADFDIKNYAVYNGDVAAKHLPAADANAPIDTIALNNRVLGPLTDRSLTSYSSWSKYENASVSVKEENGQKYIHFVDDDAAAQINIQRQDLDFRSGIKTIAFDLRINTLNNGGPNFELYDTYLGTSWVRIEFNKAISHSEGKAVKTLAETPIKGKWVSVIVVINADNNTYTFYYNGTALATNAAPTISSNGTQRYFNEQLIDLEIRSNKATTGADFDVKNYALYTGDMAAQLLSGYTPVEPPAPDPNVPLDTIDLSKKQVGLLTDTSLTNYSNWSKTEKNSVSVKEENGQKYINVVDNDAEYGVAVQRRSLDLRSGVKTIAFDMRINTFSSGGPNVELYDIQKGTSWVRIEFNKAITYASGKGMKSLTETPIKGQWASVVIVINAEANTYTLYYNGIALVTDATPRMSGDGTQRYFNERLIDLEIRSNKATTGCDFDIRNYGVYIGDRSADLAWHAEVPEPELPKDELGLPVFDTIDMSSLEVGLLTNTSLTSYSTWKDTQNAKVSVKEENGQKYFNVVDDNEKLQPGIYRSDLDFTKGTKTITFDLRINALGEGGAVEVEIYDRNAGTSRVRIQLHADAIRYYLNSKAITKANGRATIGGWQQIILVVNAEANTYSFYYGGKEILYEVPPKDNEDIKTQFFDLEIRGGKPTVGADFDIRNYKVYTGDRSYTLLGQDDPNAPVDVNNAGTKGAPGKVLDTSLGLPYSDNYKWSKVDINTSTYDNYLKKRADLAASITAAGGSANEVKVVDPIAVRGAVEVYVAPNGSDKNNGSKQNPLKTLRRALAFVAELEAAGAQGVVVYLREGTYYADKTLSIGEKHSGKNNIPVIISAYPNEEVILSGGREIAGSEFTKVTDEAVLKRLQDEVEDNIVVYDLNKLGLTYFGQISGYNAAGGPNYKVQINGENLTLARYPNFTTIRLNRKVIDPGPIQGEHSISTGAEFVLADRRPLQWENDGNIWFKGALCFEWRIENQRVDYFNQETRSVKLAAELTGDATVFHRGAKANDLSTYYFYNILEELDIPGEYYLDTEKGLLYVYPTCDMSTATVTYTQTSVNLIEIKNASNIVINGLILENTVGTAVKMYNCNQVIVQNCDIRNVGAGVVISGQKSGVINTNMKWINGLSVNFENPEFSRNNFMQNCYLYCGENTSQKSSEINVEGNGHVISHNLIKDTYNIAMYIYKAKECVVEYNEVVGGPTGTADAGSIYHYTTMDTYNNHIRFNYVHDTGLNYNDSSDPWAIYLDDASCGSFVYGNIVQNTPGGLFTNSGSSHVFADNVVVNGREGTTSGVNMSNNYKEKTFEDWIAKFPADGRNFELYKADAAYRADLISKSPATARRMEWLKENLANGGDGAGWLWSKDNQVTNNIIANHKDIRADGTKNLDKQTIWNNTILKRDPFVDSKNHDFTLKENTTLEEGTTYVAPDMSRMGIVSGKKTMTPIEGYYPEDGAENINPFDVLLRWFGGEGADSFEVIIAKNKEMTEDVKTIVVTSKACSIVNDDYFEYETTYYWTVKGKSITSSNAETDISCEHVYSFKTMTYEQYMDKYGAVVTELLARIEEAKAFLAEIKELSEGGQYYYGTKAALKAAIEKAEAIAAIGRQQTQDEADDAEQEMRYAIKRAQINVPVQHVTFPQFVVDQWLDNYRGTGTTYTKLEGDELQLSYPKPGQWTEFAYMTPFGDRDVVHFQLKIDTLEPGNSGSWFGICIGRTNVETWYSSANNAGYYVVIKYDVIEFQMEGKILMTLENKYFRPGQWHDIQLAALKNTDNTIRVIFVVDGETVFSYTDFEAEGWSGDNHFSVTPHYNTGTIYLKAAENIEHGMADYTALDEEIAKEPANGASIYSERTWNAYLEVLNAAKNLPRNLSEFDQQAVDALTKALKEAREGLLTPEQEAALEAGKDPGKGPDEKNDNNLIVIIAICAAGVIVLAGAVVLILKLRKKKALASAEEAEGEEATETGETETV